MKTRPKNYFESNEDLKILTEKCIYISLSIADVAITDKGNIFIKLNNITANIGEEVEKVVIYLIQEGWSIKKSCNVFLY